MNDKMGEASYKHALSGVECVQSVKFKVKKTA